MLPRILEQMNAVGSVKTTRRSFLVASAAAVGAFVIGYGAAPVRAAGGAAVSAARTGAAP